MMTESWMLCGSAAFLLFAGCAATASTEPADSAEVSKTQITVLYDAFGKDAATQKDWGYAALVEYRGKRILFDTGNNPDILAHNVRAKGVDLSTIDFVVMSHRHGDHMGGLSYVLSVNPKVKIYAPKEGFGVYGADLPGTFYRKDSSLPPEQRYYNGAPPDVLHFGSAWPGANFQLVDKTTEIAPNIHLIALVSDKPGTLELRELSLAINTPDGMVIVVGCSHPGIDKIVESARAINPRIHFIAGGFHLVVANDPDIEKIVMALHDTYKVEFVAPGHCTGEPAFAALRKAFGDHYLYAGLGSTLESGATSRMISRLAQPTHDTEGDQFAAGRLAGAGAERNETLPSTASIDLSFPMRLEACSVNGSTVVRCSGKLIASTANFFKAEALRRMDHCKVLTVDLTELTQTDGSGLRALISLSHSAQQAGCKFQVNTTPAVEDLLQLTGLADGRTEPTDDSSCDQP